MSLIPMAMAAMGGGGGGGGGMPSLSASSEAHANSGNTAAMTISGPVFGKPPVSLTTASGAPSGAGWLLAGVVVVALAFGYKAMKGRK